MVIGTNDGGEEHRNWGGHLVGDVRCALLADERIQGIDPESHGPQHGFQFIRAEVDRCLQMLEGRRKRDGYRPVRRWIRGGIASERVSEKGSLGQAGEHEGAHGEVDPGLLCGRQRLVVLA